MGFNVTPSATAEISSRNYVTAQTLSYQQSIDKFNLDSEFTRPFGSQNISGFLQMMGKTMGIKGNTYMHVEQDFIRELVKGTATAGANGASVIITLAASQGFTTAENSDDPYIATGSETTFPTRLYDVLLLPGNVRVMVTDQPAANTIEVTPLSPNEAVPTLTGTEEIPIIGNYVEEGSNSLQSTSPRVYEYKNNIARIRRTHTLTGDMLGQATWFDNLGKDGNQYAWYHEAIRNQYTNIQNDKEMLGLVGSQITNTVLANKTGFETVIGSQGFVPWLEAQANLETYNIGSFALSDLDSIITKLVKYEGCRENTLWVGHGLFTELDTVLGTDTQAVNGGVIYSNVSKDRSIAFEFSSTSRGGFTFHKKHLEMLDKPWGLGAEGLKWTNYGMIIPTDNVVAPQFDGSTEVVPSMRLVYQDRTDMTDGYKEWVHGGAGSDPTSGEDAMHVEMLCTGGLEFFAANRFGLLKPN